MAQPTENTPLLIPRYRPTDEIIHTPWGSWTKDRCAMEGPKPPGVAEWCENAVNPGLGHSFFYPVPPGPAVQALNLMAMDKAFDLISQLPGGDFLVFAPLMAAAPVKSRLKHAAGAVSKTELVKRLRDLNTVRVLESRARRAWRSRYPDPLGYLMPGPGVIEPPPGIIAPVPRAVLTPSREEAMKVLRARPGESWWALPPL